VEASAEVPRYEQPAHAYTPPVQYASSAEGSGEWHRLPQEPPQIEKGQTPDQVEAAFGHPDRVFNHDGKLIWVYRDLKVTFLNGRVTDAE
jgi:hypothetical protein